MDSKELLATIYQRVKSDASQINAVSLVIGAIAAILISAAVGPMITGGVANEFNERNWAPYETPPVAYSVSIEENYTVEGEDLEEFGGAEYNNSVQLYEIGIANNGNRPVQDVDISVPLPGCVIEYNTDGVGSEVNVVDYVSLDLKGQSEGLDVYSCSKTISAEQLDPGDTVSVRVLLRISFDECDLLQGVGTTNQMAYDYQWQKNGIQFFESGKVGIGFGQNYQEAFENVNQRAVSGKSVELRNVTYTNYIVSNSTSIPHAMGECRLKNT